MRAAEREALRRRFEFRCGYCGVSEQDAGAELTVDHFQPRSKGGGHEPANWVYCCHACNEFKGDHWAPDSPERVLHPLDDDLAAHVREEADGTLSAQSPTGTFHIAKLQLNRPQLVAFRRERQRLDAALAAHAGILTRLRALETELQDLTRELEDLGHEPREHR